uniref:Uncharacterized protein n=1 Tax=Psychrobacter sp. (strain PRwf-1) TaxID=349106 RepID=A5WBF9_PSYWF
MAHMFHVKRMGFFMGYLLPPLWLDNGAIKIKGRLSGRRQTYHGNLQI